MVDPLRHTATVDLPRSCNAPTRPWARTERCTIYGTRPHPGCWRTRRSRCSTADDPSARERVDHPDLHPASTGGPGRQGPRAPCPDAAGWTGDRACLRRVHGPGACGASRMTGASADAGRLPADPRSAARIQAAQTRAASGPTTKPLSPPAAVASDALFGQRGRILRRHAYDLGSGSAGSAGADLAGRGYGDPFHGAIAGAVTQARRNPHLTSSSARPAGRGRRVRRGRARRGRCRG